MLVAMVAKRLLPVAALLSAAALVACGGDGIDTAGATGATTGASSSGASGTGGQGGGGGAVAASGAGGASIGSGGAGGGPDTSVGGGGAGTGGAGGGGPQQVAIDDPVYPHSLPDPFVLRVGDTWHAYGTSASGKHIPHLVSTDLQTWKLAGDAMPTIGASWIDENAPMTWAPSVLKINASRYVLYYAAHVAGTTKRHCVGRAIASAPEGPFLDQSSSPLVCVGASAWSLDPSPFRDTNGNLYLVWRQDLNGNSHVASRRLGPLGGAFASGTSMTLILDHTPGSWEDSSDPNLGHLIENPAMTRAASGTYYVFYSGNSWQSADYATGYATCTTPTGPCTKKTKNAPWLSKDDPNAPWVNAAGKMLGPGGLDFFHGPGTETWVAWHAWVDKVEGQAGAARQMFLAEFAIDAQGKPQVSPPFVTK